MGRGVNIRYHPRIYKGEHKKTTRADATRQDWRVLPVARIQRDALIAQKQLTQPIKRFKLGFTGSNIRNCDDWEPRHTSFTRRRLQEESVAAEAACVVAACVVAVAECLHLCCRMSRLAGWYQGNQSNKETTKPSVLVSAQSVFPTLSSQSPTNPKHHTQRTTTDPGSLAHPTQQASTAHCGTH